MIPPAKLAAVRRPKTSHGTLIWRRKAPPLQTSPVHNATVLVALAGIGGTPVNSRVGNAMKLPPPATAFITPAINAAPNSRTAFRRLKPVPCKGIPQIRFWIRSDNYCRTAANLPRAVWQPGCFAGNRNSLMRARQIARTGAIAFRNMLMGGNLRLLTALHQPRRIAELATQNLFLYDSAFGIGLKKRT